MKLLITTQAVDQHDPILGFFHRWIIEFAKYAESVEVICLYEGTHNLPANVHVHSLGKEKGSVPNFIYAFRFKQLIKKLSDHYDEVFVHMNPEYVILGSRFWHRTNKRVGLWYLHKSVDMKLKVAERFADVIFTASKESFRLPSRKVQIVGHGIDTDVFSCSRIPSAVAPDPLRVVTVGRVTRAKNLHILIDAMAILAEKGVNVEFDIIGAPVRADDRAYAAELAEKSKALPERLKLRMLGAKEQHEVAQALCGYDLFIHASTGTGSLDKAMLEALSAGLPVVSTSEAFKALLMPHGLFVPEGTEHGIAAATIRFQSRSDREVVRTELRETVVRDYSLAKLIPRILGLLGTLQEQK